MTEVARVRWGSLAASWPRQSYDCNGLVDLQHAGLQLCRICAISGILCIWSPHVNVHRHCFHSQWGWHCILALELLSLRLCFLCGDGSVLCSDSVGMDHLEMHAHQIATIDTNPSQLQRSLNNFSNNKAYGPDLIHFQSLKRTPDGTGKICI